MRESVSVFAPATVANLGPGFDLLGLAVRGPGDVVQAARRGEPGVTIEAISGDDGRLPLDAARNTAGIAARETLRLAGAGELGVALTIRKGLPLGSGLGSSGASAAAAAWAVNLLLGCPLEKVALLEAALEAEAGVSGRHADNVAPALLGGLVMVEELEPVSIRRLPAPEGLTLVLVTPDFELPTRRAREVVPRQVPLADHVANAGKLATMIAALYERDLVSFGAAMVDRIVEPARASLIPGYAAAMAAARGAGALGATISGAGPTLVAIAGDPARASVIAGAMQEAFRRDARLASRARVVGVDRDGAREIEEA